MDQVTEQRLDQPADSREELVIDQGQGSQAPAPTQLLTSKHLGQSLATSIGDSDSKRNIIGENSEEARLVRKRMNDRNYRERQRDEKKALEKENDLLKVEIQEKDKREQSMKSKLETVEAENERLKCELEEKKQLTKSLLGVIGVVKEQQISTTNMQRLVDQIKTVVDGFASLNQTVAELQQNITQPPGAHIYAQPWQPQHNILIDQGSHAAATTLRLTPPAGTSRMQQEFQSPRTFTEGSHRLPDFSLQEQLGQTAHTIGVSPEFSLHQRQGGNTAVESQPFTHQGLLDQDADLDEFFSSFFEPGFGPMFFQGAARRCERVRNPARSTKQAFQEKQELCQEDQQMKSNIEALEAENKRMKREIKEKERQMKFNLRTFLVDDKIFRNQMEDKKFGKWRFEYKNRQLELEIEEKERLMKSNMEAFEAENGRSKLGIGENEQPRKSNLEAFDAQNERLKREIEETRQLMKSNLKEFEAQNGRLGHEIPVIEQLVKSNLETLEAQIRQLVDEFESLNVASVSVDLKVQTHQPPCGPVGLEFGFLALGSGLQRLVRWMRIQIPKIKNKVENKKELQDILN